MKGENREYQKAVDYLMAMIKSGSLTVNSRLPTERAISSELDISRNSTREAMRSLENMGIIQSRHGSGNYFTGDISKALSSMMRTMLVLEKFDKSEICDFRRLMEKSVCGLIFKNCEEINDLADRCEKVISGPFKSVDDEISADTEFHYILIDAAGNRLIISLMTAINELYRGWIESVIFQSDTGLRKKFLQTHTDIIKAIKNRDLPECEKAINSHYDLIDKVWRKDSENEV